jgi:hypothetical protein
VEKPEVRLFAGSRNVLDSAGRHGDSANSFATGRQGETEFQQWPQGRGPTVFDLSRRRPDYPRISANLQQIRAFPLKRGAVIFPSPPIGGGLGRIEMSKRHFCTAPAVIIIEGTNERIQVVAELPVDLVLRQMVIDRRKPA